MTDVPYEEWRRRAARLAPRTHHHIGGAFVPSRDGATFPVISPRDGRAIADVAAAAPRTSTAPWPRRGTPSTRGRGPACPPAGRRAALLRLADLVERDREALALLVTLEMGKPVTEADGIELRALIGCLRWYAEAADKLIDESPRTGADSLALVTREPAGVVGAVVPWNFPLTMAAWKIAPALAAGCTVVLKPAEESPLSALHLAALAAEAGLPDGVLNVVNGRGEPAGRALGEHPGVDVIAFTGSTEVGRHFLRYAAGSNLKRVWLELGGKSPNIILPDAPDLDAAADTAAWGVFFNAGEMCTAPSRLLVHRSVAGRVLDRIVARAGSLAVGGPARSGDRDGPPRLGPPARPRPVVPGGRGRRGRPAARRGLRDRRGRALRAPVRVRPGEARDEDRPGGDLRPGAGRAGVRRHRRGRAPGQRHRVRPGRRAVDLRPDDRAPRLPRAPGGTVWVNCYEEGDMSVPFGGVKQSGNGRDKSLHALDKYLDLKTTWIAL
ncbi:aldehyde dehydrogenase family protein [Actinomadura madurae]|nr:aldehyde dehydrogenase family protein [Actinomadura madurae]